MKKLPYSCQGRALEAVMYTDLSDPPFPMLGNAYYERNCACKERDL